MTPSFNVEVWRAARATCADPVLGHDPIEIDHINYFTSEIGYNNPVQIALEEAQCVSKDRPISVIISIGAGMCEPVQVPEEKDRKFAKEIMTAMHAIVKDCEKKADEMDAMNEKPLYIRLMLSRAFRAKIWTDGKTRVP